LDGRTEKRPNDAALVCVIADIVNGADSRMIERRGRASFALKSFERRFVGLKIGGEKFDRDESSEPRVFAFVDETHAAGAERFEDAIVGDDDSGLHRGKSSYASASSGARLLASMAQSQRRKLLSAMQQNRLHSQTSIQCPEGPASGNTCRQGWQFPLKAWGCYRITLAIPRGMAISARANLDK
jgi:hypothetical protein